ncbi:MAG: VanZ family protein [Acidobacteriota bacterium]
MFQSKLIYIRLITALYASLIIYSSTKTKAPLDITRYFPDYLLHFIEYGILGVLLFLSISRNPKESLKRNAAVTIFISFLFGILNEIIQSFVPGREASIKDIVFNLFGSIIFLSALSYFHKNKL